MKFKVPSNVDASQESLTGFVTFGLTIVLSLTILKCYEKLKAWRASKMSPEQKLVKILKEMTSNKYLYPGCLDRFPTTYGLSDEQSDRDYNGHWGPIENAVDLTATAIPLKTFIKEAKQLGGFVKFMAGLSGTDGCIEKIDNYIKSNFKKNDLAYLQEDDNEPKLIGFGHQPVNVRWPKSEYWDNPEKCCDQLANEFNQYRSSFGLLSKKVSEVIRAYTNDVPEEEIKERVAFVEAAMKIVVLYDSIVEDFTQVFYDLADIDVDWYDAE